MNLRLVLSLVIPCSRWFIASPRSGPSPILPEGFVLIRIQPSLVALDPFFFFFATTEALFSSFRKHWQNKFQLQIHRYKLQSIKLYITKNTGNIYNNNLQIQTNDKLQFHKGL